MPPRNSLRQPIPNIQPGQDVSETLIDVLNSIEGLKILEKNPPQQRSSSDAQIVHFVVEAAKNTWSRSARRKKVNTEEKSHVDIAATEDPGLTCRLRISGEVESAQSSRRSSTAGCMLQIDWIRGKDRGLYESFVSHVGRKLQVSMKSLNDGMET